MKKLIFPVLALVAALTVSCNKEQGTESPAAKASQKVTIEASIAGTKTAYANDKTFSWLAGDKISVMEDLDGTVKFNEFTAASEGPTTTFDGEISDGATLGKWAVYPSTLNPTVADGVFSVTLPSQRFLDYSETASTYVSSTNPMANLPLVGQKQVDDSYKFTTAMGVVKFTITNVPAEAHFFVLRTATEPISGTFFVDTEGTITIDNATSGSTMAYFVISPEDGSTMAFYFPIPVGTLGAGLKVELLAEDGSTSLFSRSTVSEIEVVRNRVTEVAALNAKPAWTSLGTGKYSDAHFFGPGVYFDVTIEQNSENPNQYRISDPYTSAWESYGYTPGGTVSGPGEYLTINILPDGGTISGISVPAGTVTFDNYLTGYFDTEYETEIQLIDAESFGMESADDYIYSRLLRSQTNGTPANIQLAPCYYFVNVGGYTSDFTENGNIQIVFPGCDPIDMTGNLEILGLSDASTTAAPALSVAITLGADMTAAIAVGTSLNEAITAILDGQGSSVSSGTTEISLPANAQTGTYTVAMITYLDGEAWDAYSDTYDYVNPDQEPLTVNDIIGDYTVTYSSYYDEEGSEPSTTSFTIAASDDATKGNVMFTGTFLDVTVSTPIYATFEETGKLTITNNQTFGTFGTYTMKMQSIVVSGGSLYLGTDSPVLQFSAPGVFQSAFGSYYLGILTTDNRVYDIFTALSGIRKEVIAEEGGEVVPAGAPAKAPRLSRGLKGQVSVKGDLVKMK